MLTILQLMNWISRIFPEIEVQPLSSFWVSFQKLRQAIANLTPTLSPRLSDRLVSHHVPYDVTCNVLGVMTEADPNFEQLRIVALTPGLPAARYLGDKNLLGHIIITINGIRIHSVTDIQHILHDYHGDLDENKDLLSSLVLLIFSESQILELQNLINLTLQSRIFQRCSQESHSISYYITNKSSSLTQNDCYRVTGGGTDPQKATKEMDKALLPQPDNGIIAYIRSIIMSSMDLDADVPLDDVIAFVQSIMALDLNPICPKFWHHAMKDLAHKSCWIEAMFKHHDSCYAIGTFGPPRIPPPNVTVLPAIIVLKMVINAVKQINAHKVFEYVYTAVIKNKVVTLKNHLRIPFLVSQLKKTSQLHVIWLGSYSISTSTMLFKHVQIPLRNQKEHGSISIKLGWISITSNIPINEKASKNYLIKDIGLISSQLRCSCLFKDKLMQVGNGEK
jgi:hypothetical protein